jgi:hypothetical protein
MYKFKNYSDLKLLKLENVHAILKTKKTERKSNQERNKKRKIKGTRKTKPIC